MGWRARRSWGAKPLAIDFGREGVDRFADVRLAVLAADKKSQSGQLLGYRRIQDRLHVDATLHQRGGNARGTGRTAEDRRDHGETGARSGIDASSACEAQEQAGA